VRAVPISSGIVLSLSLSLCLAASNTCGHSHIENARKFGVPVVIAINRFATDTDAELELIREKYDLPPFYACSWGSDGVRAMAAGAYDAVVCSHWALGGRSAFYLIPTLPVREGVADVCVSVARRRLVRRWCELHLSRAGSDSCTRCRCPCRTRSLPWLAR
jgi:hypothetical protein